MDDICFIFVHTANLIRNHLDKRYNRIQIQDAGMYQYIKRGVWRLCVVGADRGKVK